MKIILTEYNPLWPKLFSEEKKRIQEVLRKFPVKVEHIGSTAIPGLCAKHVIDMMVGIEKFSLSEKFIFPIVSLGYDYIPKYENEMPSRKYFVRAKNGVHSHHIHLVEIGCDFWQRHLLFRDFLRENENFKQEYVVLKKSLAEKEWNSGNDYAAAKTGFIRRIEQLARTKRSG